MTAAAAGIEIGDFGGFAREVKARSGASPMSCLQCAKCSSGCPVAGRADLRPHEAVRLVQMDQRQAVLASRFIWECTSCQTCATRCPQNVNPAAMNDALRAMSRAAGAVVAGADSPAFHDVFLDAVRRRGRVSELSLMMCFKLRTRRFFRDAGKAPVMLLKGKLPLTGKRVAGRAGREAMFRKAAEGGAE